MTEMILRHFKRLPNSDETIAAQVRAQFPEGWERHEAERAEQDIVELRKVVDAIAHAGEDDNCDTALQAFRDYLERPQGVIKTGKHFNIQLLVEAFKLYDANYDRFGGWGSHQNNLFWRKVIGYVQRFVPACYAQAFCQ